MVLLLALLPNLAFGQCSATSEVDEADSGGTQTAYDQFGYSIAIGNFDGENGDDLAVAVPGETIGTDANTGLMVVYYGGEPLSSAHRWSQTSISGAANDDDDGFGQVLAVGDFNDDGFDDLVIGTPLEDEGTAVNSGRVSVRYGDPDGIPSSNPSDSFSQDDVAGNGEATGDQFGAALAVGDFNGDSYHDLAIGVPNDDISGAATAGRIVVVYGSGSGLDVGTSETITQSNWSSQTPEAGDHFGTALAAGDFDNDGYDDLAIGVPGEDRSSLTDVGWVQVKFGDSVGLKDSATGMGFGAGAFGATDRAGDQIGEHLAAGRVENDAYHDLVIGIPNKDTAVLTDAGMVGILFGAFDAADLGSDDMILQADDFGLTNEDDMEFGYSVHVGDLDANARGDVIVGIPYDVGTQGSIAAYFPATTDDFVLFDEACMGGSNQNYHFFGRELATGDFDADGRNELAVGDYNEGLEYGIVRIGTITP